MYIPIGDTDKVTGGTTESQNNAHLPADGTGGILAEVRSVLINSGFTSRIKCDGYGYGYFSGDPESEHEPLLYARSL
ncbi:MAG: hypothetical protein WBX01_02065 [Nitrososphaeraceae archaeon]